MENTEPRVPALWLHCQPESGIVIPITRLTDTTQIGRHPKCGIQVPSDFVSRHHAEIFFKGGSWWVKDLNSRNGVYINNRKTELARLKNASTLQLGRQLTFKVFVDQATG